MKQKVILISIDGMRSDGLRACGNPYLAELEKKCSYTYAASSCNPPVTLPCHYSMTHSVEPNRHGILTNTFVPLVRPVTGLFEKIRKAGGITAMFYGWEPLRDISPPKALRISTYLSARMIDECDKALTDEALRQIETHRPDFAFLYLVDTDEKGGHDHGWMSAEYLRRISVAIDQVKRVMEAFEEEYTILIMTDHGGHDRTHGLVIPEDMTIPFFFCGKDFPAGENVSGATLLDLAPTIAELMGFDPDPDWEGKSLVPKV